MTIKKKFVFAGVITLCLAVAAAFLLPPIFSKEDRLTEEQIGLLRKDYPIYYQLASPMVDHRIPELEEIIEIGDTFAYVEVISDRITYEKTVPTGLSALDEKRETMGLGVTFSFAQHRLQVLGDSEGVLQRGTEILVEINCEFEPYTPVLQKGARFILPLSEGEEGIYDYCTVGAYYVTEDGYCLTAFDEQLAKDTNGRPVAQVLKLVKK